MSEIETSESAMGTSLKSAAEVLTDLKLAKSDWQIFEAIQKLGDDRQQAAPPILERLKIIFQSDELAVQLGPALKEVKTRATRLLAAPPRPHPAPPQRTTQPESTSNTTGQKTAQLGSSGYRGQTEQMGQTAIPVSQIAGGQSVKILDSGTMEDMTEKGWSRYSCGFARN